MRLLLAGLFVHGVLLIAVLLLSDRIGHGSPVVSGIGLGFLLLLLCLVALVVFNVPGTQGKLGVDGQEYIRALEEKGLLLSTEFNAVRAFQVEEWDDEGLHYFIELTNGSVLYLTGQYLYEYEPIEDDPEFNQSRQFPCSDFTIKQHHKKGFVVEIVCRGTVLEPELVAPPFEREDYRLGRVPEDSQIITEEPYEHIKERMARPDNR